MNETMPPFEGFGDQAISFWSQLEANNNRTFFTAHRDVYDHHIREPLERLLAQVGPEFGENGKVFRPHRDVRFSKDKSPYKLAGAAAIGDDSGSCAVYYVQIGANGLFAASGIYLMTRDQLQRFYAAIDDEASGEELKSLVAQTRAKGAQVGGSALKTAPRGYSSDHPRVELLRHKSLTVAREYDPGHDWIFSAAALQKVTDLWREAAPINDWLAAHVGHPRS
ncbi:MAG: DUF2461 domain-containing protein [Ornithinimicrobium sp.]